MLVKNVFWYFIDAQSSSELSSFSLNAAAAEKPFRACAKAAMQSMGFVNPVTQQADGHYIHAASGAFLLAVKEERKVLPAKAVNQQLALKMAAISEKEGRQLGSKERAELKDELIFSMLGQAFTVSDITYVIIDKQSNNLLIAANSNAAADAIAALLKASLTDFKFSVAQTEHEPQTVMTNWLLEQDALDFELHEQCELKADDETKAVVRLLRHDLNSAEIESHLRLGKKVVKLGLKYREQVQFLLDENMVLRRIKWLEELLEQQADTDDAQAAFDADFVLVVETMRHLLAVILESFGGKKEN